MSKDDRFGLIASAILQGTSIDWTSVESSAGPGDATVIRQLQVVAEIAALHRRLSDTPSPHREGVVPAPAQWGHLRLLERVGHGTFGDVFRAWDTHLDREVALKLLRAAPRTDGPSATLSDPGRVVNEGRLLARVRHPHVITVYGAEPRDGSVGLWMEFVRGRTLRQIIDAHGPMSAREVVAIGVDLCRALAAVHRAGLLHRDVTAGNVMREEGGRVVLMDFGVGHEQSAITRGDIAGTPPYLAPELFAGVAAAQTTDIYSLGALLFYLATGTFPVSGRSLSDIRAAHAQGQRRRLRDVRGDLPAGFVSAVEHAIATDPAQRFQTAGALEGALENALTGRTNAGSRVQVAGMTLVAVLVSVLVWTVASRDSGEGQRSSGPEQAASALGLTTRQLSPSAAVWPFSNPSADGRYAAGMVNATGDAALVDLVTGTYRPLGVGRGDYSDGWASMGLISADGSTIAVGWHDDAGGSLRLVRADGSGRRVLIPTPGDVWPYQWSHDGTMILAAVTDAAGVHSIALVAVADGAVRPIRTLDGDVPDMMSLSPDGRYIVYDYPPTPTSVDRDLYILDTHTARQWPLDEATTHETSPFWTPDGRGIVFLSNRNRSPSIWSIRMENGRPIESPRLLRDDIGRVWLRGFTRGGALHYQLSAGFAEAYVASLDRQEPIRALTPREPISNFYPRWSRDGHLVVFSSERGGVGRELWVLDTAGNHETRVPTRVPLIRPFGWSADSSRILASGPDQQLYVIDRTSGHTQLVATGVPRGAWGPAGIMYVQQRRIVVYDDRTKRVVRTFEFGTPDIAAFTLSWDGRSALSLDKSGRLALHDPETGRSEQWHESGISGLGNHFKAPHAAGVAYVAHRKGMNGDVKTLMYRGGSGEPRELLRATLPDEFVLSGWASDGLSLFVIRYTSHLQSDVSTDRNESLWRIPITSGAPTQTGVAMEGLRDVSIHPDGRTIAFNAGWKRGELWVMENLLPK